MLNNLNNTILSLSCLILFILCVNLIIFFIIYICRTNKKLHLYKKERTRYKSYLNYIEYEMKNYKEGKNCYTTLRNIQNMLYCIREDYDKCQKNKN